MSEQPPILKNNKIYKDGKLKKWFKRTVTLSVCVVVMGVGIGGVAIGNSRPNIYLHDVKLLPPGPIGDVNFNITIDWNTDREHANPGSSTKSLAFLSSFNDGKDHWNAGYSEDWTIEPADSLDDMPSGLWIEKVNMDEFGWVKWDENLTVEQLDNFSPLYPSELFRLSIFAYGPGGAKTGDGDNTLSSSVIFHFALPD